MTVPVPVVPSPQSRTTAVPTGQSAASSASDVGLHDPALGAEDQHGVAGLEQVADRDLVAEHRGGLVEEHDLADGHHAVGLALRPRSSSQAFTAAAVAASKSSSTSRPAP